MGLRILNFFRRLTPESGLFLSAGVQRDLKPEGGAACGIVMGSDLASVFFDEFLADG